jgi:hypothetical protein
MLIVVAPKGHFLNVVLFKGELDIVMVITAFGVFVYSTFTIIAGLLFENKLACFRHTSFFWLSLGTLYCRGKDQYS